MKICAAFFVLLFAFTCSSFSQDEASDNKSDESGKAAETSQAAMDTAPGNVTMDFKDADISNVLRILSYKSGMNIVAGKDVTGLITIRLTDVP